MRREDAVRLVGSQLRPEVIYRYEEDVHWPRGDMRDNDSKDQGE